MAITETGTYKTEAASKYLQQLCKHLGHKVEATFDETQGNVALGMGPARLQANETALTVEINAADEEGIKTARHVIDAHLKRFAFREDFDGFEWHRA